MIIGKKILVLILLLLFCSIPLLFASNASPKTTSSPQQSLGVGFRFGPFSFLGVEGKYTYSVSDTLSLRVTGGYVADLQIRIFNYSPSNSYHAIETGIGLLYEPLSHSLFNPYISTHFVASIPVVDFRSLIFYLTGGAGLEITIGPISIGAEAGIVLLDIEQESSTTTLTWGDWKAYVGPSIRWSF